MSSSSSSVRERVALLEAIAFVAIEFERQLDLTRLTSFIDLYARFLPQAVEGDEPPDFEAFVRDRVALAAAAVYAEQESGVPTIAPEPLRESGAFG